MGIYFDDKGNHHVYFEPERHPKTIWGKIGWFILDIFLGILDIIKSVIWYIGALIILGFFAYLVM